MLDVTGFMNRPLFFLFQCLKVVQLLIGYVSEASFKTIVKNPFLPQVQIYYYALLQTQTLLMY